MIIKGFILFVLLTTIGCQPMSPTILEFKDVQFFKLDTISTTENQDELKLSGLAFHSALCVREIKQKKYSNEVQIIVYLSRCKKELSGRFEYFITISKNVEKVTFGNNRAVVWNRENPTGDHFGQLRKDRYRPSS